MFNAGQRLLNTDLLLPTVVVNKCEPDPARTVSGLKGQALAFAEGNGEQPAQTGHPTPGAERNVAAAPMLSRPLKSRRLYQPSRSF